MPPPSGQDVRELTRMLHQFNSTLKDAVRLFTALNENLVAHVRLMDEQNKLLASQAPNSPKPKPTKCVPEGCGGEACGIKKPCDLRLSG